MLILGFLKRSQVRVLERTWFAQGDQELGFCRMMDRVGHLPDDLLLQILSYLSTIAVLITSVLSKRWLSLWMLLPKLYLDGTCSEEEIVSCLEIASNRNLREPKMEGCFFVAFELTNKNV
ncbi:hypothetical protein F2Q70_00024789 [Brassica cretica]|uniref:F-box domain-containing protein n=1 Tax=Brassica cretica TaxID=69181 RepID=A0A8S9LFB1_BRACR|nr:hypothetical protein F2Q70_00024789 [Brassica cretica]